MIVGIRRTKKRTMSVIGDAKKKKQVSVIGEKEKSYQVSALYTLEFITLFPISSTIHTQPINEYFPKNKLNYSPVQK
jgi:hypothetical protein